MKEGCEDCDSLGDYDDANSQLDEDLGDVTGEITTNCTRIVALVAIKESAAAVVS